MKKIRIKADVSKANGFKIWKHCDEVGADTDGHIYQKIKGIWYYAYEYVNKWKKCKLIPEHYTNCYKRVHLIKSDKLETLGLCRCPILSHVLVYKVFNDTDKLPVGYTIDHLDNDKLNNKLNNLELVTRGENSKRGWNRRSHEDIESYKELYSNAVKAAHKAGHYKNHMKKLNMSIKEAHKAGNYKDHLNKLHMSNRKENKGE